MRKALRQLFLVARATSLEGLQQPIALLLTLSCVLLTSLGPLVHLHVFGEEGRLARDNGLALMLVFGLLVVGFTAGFTITEELRRGTAAALLAKPVGRMTFLLGKWMGVVGVLVVFAAASTMATLLAERTAERFVETASFYGSTIDRYSGIGSLAVVALALLLAGLLNFFRGLRFGLAAFVALISLQGLLLAGCGFITRTGERPAAFDVQLNPRVLSAAFLIFLLLMLYAAVGSAVSTRCGTTTTLAIFVILLFIGFLADSLFGQSHGMPSRLCYALVPDVQHFWLADALANGGRIPLSYLAEASVHAVAYTSAVLLLGTAAFLRRDVP